MRTRKPVEALELVGRLSNPSKMPTLSWSISAFLCKLGALLARIPGSTCFRCYALSGCYRWPSTINAMDRRLAALELALSSESHRQAWLEAWRSIFAWRYAQTARAIERTGKPPQDDGRYFRFFDAGDHQNVEHLALMIETARTAPQCQFWLPTRETGMLARYLETGATLPPNLTIRLSVPRIDAAPAGKLLALVRAHPTVVASGVHSHAGALPADYVECRAYLNAHKCGECRECFKPDRAVSYPIQ